MIGYLNFTQTTTLDAFGNGSIVMAPDTGEFWAPSFVRVSADISLSGAAPLHATLYHGATNIANYTTFIDETYLGQGDVSSIVAGTVVQRGETLMAKWVGGTPGTIVVMSLYGRVADSLPAIASVLAAIPGARFRGADQSVLGVFDLRFRDIGGNTVVNLNPAEVKLFGNTFFNSYGADGIYLSIQSSINLLGTYFPAKISMDWDWNTSTQQVDEFVVPATGPGVTLTTDFIFPVRSNRFGIRVTAPTANATTVIVNAYSCRNPSGIPQTVFNRNLLYSRVNIVVGAGAIDQVPNGRTWLGPAVWHVDSTAATWTMNINYIDVNGVTTLVASRSSADIRQDTLIYLPAAPLQMTFANTSGAAAPFSSWLYAHSETADF